MVKIEAKGEDSLSVMRWREKMENVREGDSNFRAEALRCRKFPRTRQKNFPMRWGYEPRQPTKMNKMDAEVITR